MKKICLTCSHWQGDRERQYKEVEERGEICLDLDKGWPLCGDCPKLASELDMRVVGDCWAEFQVASSFGCILHEDIEEEPNHDQR